MRNQGGKNNKKIGDKEEGNPEIGNEYAVK